MCFSQVRFLEPYEKDAKDKEKWEIINDPVDGSGKHRTRFIATGFILTKDGE